MKNFIIILLACLSFAVISCHNRLIGDFQGTIFPKGEALIRMVEESDLLARMRNGVAALSADLGFQRSSSSPAPVVREASVYNPYGPTEKEEAPSSASQQ